MSKNTSGRSYAPHILLAVAAVAVAVAAKFAEETLKTVDDGRYARAATAAFCVVAALCAYLTYRAIMNIGNVWDERHPKAASEATSREFTPDELCAIVRSLDGGRVEFDISAGGEKIVAGHAIRPLSASEEKFEELYYVGESEFSGEADFHDALAKLATGGRLTVTETRSDTPLDDRTVAKIAAGDGDKPTPTEAQSGEPTLTETQSDAPSDEPSEEEK